MVHALLQGRQTVLLRKGGIHEKAFGRPAEGGGFVLFPTVAHSHDERTRPEFHDLLATGAADVHDDHVVLLAGIMVAAVVDVARPDALPQIGDLHLWTDDSIAVDRVAFRPTQALKVLVVRAVELPHPVVLPRREGYGGCRSWIDVDTSWRGEGRAVLSAERIAADVARVRGTVG